MKNFIWDFDGTLFDTYPHTVTILHDYMKELGKDLDFAGLYSICRVHLGKAREYCGASEEQWQEFYRREAHMDTPPHAKPYAGTRETLAAVVASGGKNFLYTHRDTVSVKYLRAFDLLPYFTGYITSENRMPWKPAPDAILYLIDQFDLNPLETVMVGDREIDILSGVNAGVHTCLFTDGNPDAVLIKNTKAEAVAENMAALRALYLL